MRRKIFPKVPNKCNYFPKCIFPTVYFCWITEDTQTQGKLLCAWLCLLCLVACFSCVCVYNYVRGLHCWHSYAITKHQATDAMQSAMACNWDIEFNISHWEMVRFSLLANHKLKQQGFQADCSEPIWLIMCVWSGPKIVKHLTDDARFRK